MKPDLARIRESKQAFRRELAERPISEKLRMLDALRERTLAIRHASNSEPAQKAIVQETPPLPDNE
jgi:hypothetical protein